MYAVYDVAAGAADEFKGSGINEKRELINHY